MRHSTSTDICLSVLAFLAILQSGRFAHATTYKLIGVDVTHTLYDVNTTTGAVSNARSTGIDGMIGIAAQPSTGQVFSLVNIGFPFANHLLQVDVTSGLATVIGPTGFSSIFEGDLAFSPLTGILYGSQNFTSAGPGARQLFKVNTATGAAMIVGTIANNVGDFSTLAFDSLGTLYAIDTGTTSTSISSFLCTLNTTTGAILSSVPLSLDLGGTAGMTFDPVSGTAYVADGTSGGTNDLYTLNTSTGVLTLVGPLGISGGLSGLAFVPVPEPGTFGLLAMGLVIPAALWRRRHRALRATSRARAPG